MLTTDGYLLHLKLSKSKYALEDQVRPSNFTLLSTHALIALSPDIARTL